MASRDNRQNRSVVDFESEDDLRRALMGDPIPDDDDEHDNGVGLGDERHPDRVYADNLDWVLPIVDKETTEVQSLGEELRRLQILKGYLILDAKREEAFERITSLAARIFNVPIALVSLVDLGRQWFMSNRGLDVRETPRKYAFCAHAILSKHDIFVVPDPTQDFRFKDNPLVTGPPYIRFYAGAPLHSPEGYKLGTFCIIDVKPRWGLSEEQQQIMKDLAKMVVKAMVDRRFQMQAEDTPSQVIAYTAHDLMTPLTGVQLSLSLLKDDEEVKQQLSPHHLELITTAANCTELMIRICRTAVDNARKRGTTNTQDKLPSSTTATNSNVPITKLVDLIRSILIVTETVQKNVPLIITLDPSVPKVILGDDLKLFRSALNLICNALDRTAVGMVHFKIYSKQDSDQLMFECEDTGSDIPVSEYPFLFKPCPSDSNDLRMGLSSLSSLIHSMDGEYGFRPRGVLHDGAVDLDDKGSRISGSLFWFSVPLYVPESFGISYEETSTNTSWAPPKIHTRTSNMRRSESITSISSARELTLTDYVKAGTEASEHEETTTKIALGPVPVSAIVTNGFSAQKPHARRIRRSLVIEDSLVVRKSLSRALVKLGFEVNGASNGLEGLQEMKNTLFDFILCDFLMPVMDGLDCVKQYRDWEQQNRPWFKQYIVGISAHANINDSGQGIKAGMDMFRPKPISIKLLTEIQESDEVMARSKVLDDLEAEADQKKKSVDLAVIDGEGVGVASMNGKPDGKIRHLKEPDLSDELDIDRKRSLDGVGDDSVAEWPKKQRTLSMDNSATPVCLMITNSSSSRDNVIHENLELNGWRVEVAEDASTALALLQKRNWDAVIVDDEVSLTSGVSCLRAFRTWEDENRITKQRNVFLVCSGSIPEPFDPTSIVQAPSGIDGVLAKPPSWKAFRYLLRKNNNNGALDIIVRD